MENAQRELSEISEHLNEEIRTGIRKLGWPMAYAKAQFQEQVNKKLLLIFELFYVNICLYLSTRGRWMIY